MSARARSRALARGARASPGDETGGAVLVSSPPVSPPPSSPARRYVCAAFLGHFSEQIRAMPGEDVQLFFQKLPTAGWGEPYVDAGAVCRG